MTDKEQPKLLERLTRQLASKGVKGAKSMAAALLQKRGQMSGGKLTAKGKKRQDMGASGRAKDRAAKRSNKSASSYKYNSKTNRATLR